MRTSIGRFMAGRRRVVAVLIAAGALITVPVVNVVASDRFADVPFSAFYHNSVTAIANAGITGGCGGDNYCPNSAVTRGQMAVFLDRVANLRNEKGPVVDAFTLDGQLIGGGPEPFILAGGAPSECRDAEPVGLPFGFYTFSQDLYNVVEDPLEEDIAVDEVNVSILDLDEDEPDDIGEYQICFRRITAGNLPAGEYDTYWFGSGAIGSGLFASSSAPSVESTKFAKLSANR